MKLYYRLFNTDDPEERLEDAALWKAIYDEFGDGIIPLGHDAEAPADGYLLGRGRNHERGAILPIGDDLPYWTDPAFLSACGRSFKLCDWDGAKAEVDRLHSEGKGAFVKSIRAKHYIVRVPVGTSLMEAADAMAFSFMDLPPCLMVQELVDLHYERRFVVINREVVTCSPVAVHLTPLDMPAVGFAHYLTPKHKAPWKYSRSLADQMLRIARSIAETMATPHAIIDLAACDGRIIAIEFNPARIGQFGLFACDVRAIAEAVRSVIPDYDDEATAVEKRKPKSEWSIVAAQARFHEMFKDKEVRP